MMNQKIMNQKNTMNILALKLIRDFFNNVENFKGLFFDWSNENGLPKDKPLFLFEIQDGQKVLVEKVVPTNK